MLLKEYFYINVTKNKMSAEIHITENYEKLKEDLSESSLKEFLQEENIIYGVVDEHFQHLLTKPPKGEYPLTIAVGKPEADGIDGKLNYEVNVNSTIEKSTNWNFRDIMRIPSVNEGDKIAVIIEPTKGEPGIDVYGNEIDARPGKPVLVKAGKNVTLNERNLTFYATTKGQISASSRFIHVHSVYELKESLSMKTGNIDFVGTVVIRGDVPAGYTIKAKGDIKIFGLVEAATLIADGSIFVSEGIAGLKLGTMHAKENIHIGYINQGNVTAGASIYVENSIIHSECIATKDIFCQRGNIIGGSISVGNTVQAKDVGNRMHTKTEIYFGINRTESNEEEKLIAKKTELQNTLDKLSIIGEKLQLQNIKHNSKLRITLLRQKHSYNKTVAQIEKVNEALERMNIQLGEVESAMLIVKGTLHANAIISFGKYKRTIDKSYDYVRMKIERNEIVILPL